jgi:hypothetical protein
MLQIIFHFNFDFDPIIRSKYFYNIQCYEPSLGGFEPNGKPNPKSLFWECKKKSNLVIKVIHHPKNNPNNNNNNSNKIIKSLVVHPIVFRFIIEYRSLRDFGP